MNMPIEVTVKTLNNVANLVAQSLNSFFAQLDNTSMAVLCFLLLLYFKYGVAQMVALMTSPNHHKLEIASNENKTKKKKNLNNEK